MNESINGYELIGEFRTDNSGSARWGFAEKDGQELFIKEFLSPTYPADEDVLPPKMVERRKKFCEKYVISKTKLYDALNKCSTGNVVGILDFFRYGAKYYIVTEKIDSIPLTIEDIAAMPTEQKHLICKIIIYCVKSLHAHQIVHCDIKHENILFKKTLMGKYVAKLIDFDASFIEDEPPAPDDEFHGDMVYYAPESVKYMLNETDHIDSKIDVFALGLLFHQYFTGHLPYFDTKEYDYAYEAVLDGNFLKSDKDVPEKYAKVIDAMLSADPQIRLSSGEVFELFDRMTDNNAEQDNSVHAHNGFFYAGDL